MTYRPFSRNSFPATLPLLFILSIVPVFADLVLANVLFRPPTKKKKTLSPPILDFPPSVELQPFFFIFMNRILLGLITQSPCENGRVGPDAPHMVLNNYSTVLHLP